jgi:hypothetical protein
VSYSQLENSYIHLYTHDEEKCFGQVCSIHNRSDHHMRKFKQFYRVDRKIMERVCSHNVGHPDPDDLSIINGTNDGEHKCDGCCIKFSDVEPEYNKYVKTETASATEAMARILFPEYYAKENDDRNND